MPSPARLTPAAGARLHSAHLLSPLKAP
uniref:Uncharacterized protein n=1 Tax=Arundo donax TaxID=35708 RepID=A0A0A9CCA4_ARUDO